MRLEQLKKVLQDNKHYGRINVLNRCYFINQISYVSLKCPLHTGSYAFADRT